MEEKQRVSYAKLYKPKPDSKLLAEYLIEATKNRQQVRRISYSNYFKEKGV